jgi:hypothetical protein
MQPQFGKDNSWRLFTAEKSSLTTIGGGQNGSFHATDRYDRHSPLNSLIVKLSTTSLF